mmetsp:Transcript_59075/g.80664  ORF Transcript_59075/g.80664 Transcript_59075/m.80664 type:complete len:114 (-) Transcript_59075:631-972(-)
MQRIRLHWDKEVVDTMKEEFFVGIMGVPNATGLWQVADSRNNAILKIKWVLKGEHDKLVLTDVVVILNMVFAPSLCDEEMNWRTIAARGVVPLTKSLLSHPEVTQGSGDRRSL